MTNNGIFKPAKEPKNVCEALYELLPRIKRNIDESPTKITSVSAEDFKKQLGQRFEGYGDADLYWMTKYGLFEDGINVGKTVVGKERIHTLLLRYRKVEDPEPKDFEKAKKHGWVCKEGKIIR